MKILVIGDFHGKFPEKIKKIAKREKIDFFISVGDHPDTSELRRLEFKYWNKLTNGGDFEEIVGKEKLRKLMNKNIASMDKPLKALKSFGKPVFAIYGNSDTLDKEAKKYGLKGLESKCKKLNIRLLKNDVASCNGWNFIGFSGCRGAMSKGFTKGTLKLMKMIKRYNKKWANRIIKISKKIKEPERTIFIAHDVPRGYFDKVLYKKSPMYGKHVGDEHFTKFLKKYQPAIFVCGHMHEYQGVKKLGKTLIVNVGDGAEGKFSIISIDEKDRVKVKLIK